MCVCVFFSKHKASCLTHSISGLCFSAGGRNCGVNELFCARRGKKMLNAGTLSFTRQDIEINLILS